MLLRKYKEAVLYFVQDLDFSTRYFKDVMQYYYCQFSPVSALQRLLTIEISQIQFLLVSAEQGFVIKGNIQRIFHNVRLIGGPLNRGFTVLKYCWFSVSRHSKQTKIQTLAKIQVRGIFRIRDILRNVLTKLIDICMETPCWCPSG